MFGWLTPLKERETLGRRLRRKCSRCVHHVSQPVFSCCFCCCPPCAVAVCCIFLWLLFRRYAVVYFNSVLVTLMIRGSSWFSARSRLRNIRLFGKPTIIFICRSAIWTAAAGNILPSQNCQTSLLLSYQLPSIHYSLHGWSGILLYFLLRLGGEVGRSPEGKHTLYGLLFAFIFVCFFPASAIGAWFATTG